MVLPYMGAWIPSISIPCIPYMVTFTIIIAPVLAYIPYMDPMGYGSDFFPLKAHVRLGFVIKTILPRV
jgi:hypothetical protein